MSALNDALPVACTLPALAITVGQLGMACASCVITAALLTHASLIVQLPTMSPPQGATLPQLPPPLLPQVETIGASAAASRIAIRPPVRLRMSISVSPVAGGGK